MNWLKARLSEPSTHAGVAAGLVIASQVFPQYALLLQGIAGLFSGAAVVKSEKS